MPRSEKQKTPARRWRYGEPANDYPNNIIAWTNILSRKIGEALCALSGSFGGQLLPRQFGAELLFLLRDKPFVTIGINEWVCAGLFPKRVLFFEAKIAAMGTEENVAWQ